MVAVEVNNRQLLCIGPIRGAREVDFTHDPISQGEAVAGQRHAIGSFSILAYEVQEDRLEQLAHLRTPPSLQVRRRRFIALIARVRP
jgi:hypothetical protein